jgi:hypothetical protein
VSASDVTVFLSLLWSVPLAVAVLGTIVLVVLSIWGGRRVGLRGWLIVAAAIGVMFAGWWYSLSPVLIPSGMSCGSPWGQLVVDDWRDPACLPLARRIVYSWTAISAVAFGVWAFVAVRGMRSPKVGESQT